MPAHGSPPPAPPLPSGTQLLQQSPGNNTGLYPSPQPIARQATPAQDVPPTAPKPLAPPELEPPELPEPPDPEPLAPAEVLAPAPSDGSTAVPPQAGTNPVATASSVAVRIVIQN